MSDVHIPTTFEIHQIAYVTQHGWVLCGESWSKAGFSRTVQDRDRYDWLETHERQTEDFDLDAAYDAQQEADRCPSTS